MRNLLLALALVMVGAPSAMAVEEPKYSVVQKDDNFEIRAYAATITADTTVAGEGVKARNDAFMPLADYIFAKDRKGGKIAVTAPVTQAPREKIAMTAPVTQEASDGGWTVSFTMPEGYTMASLPPPANPNVRLVEHPPRRMAVVSFSGTAGNLRMEKMKRELMARVADLGLTAVGEPVFAFYDPPWTLPFLRRNEVMVELVAS